MDNFIIGTIQENIKFLSNDLQVINSNIPKRINDLSNVSITGTPANGEVLTYNSSTGKFEPQAQSGGGGGALNELNDIPGVTITGVQPNQVLKYINGVWVNSTDTDTTYVGGTAITVTNNVISNDAPDQIVALTGTGGTTITGTYPFFTINSTDTDNLNGLTDTDLTTPFVDNEVLKYSSGKWINDFLNLTDLSDARATTNSLYVGVGSGTSSTGNDNTFIGINSGNGNDSGSLNTFIGFVSGEKNDSGIENTFIGAYSGLNNDDGKYNTFIGMSSGIANISGEQNTFVGVNTGYSNKANNNTFVGVNSGYANIGGYSNTFIGIQSGYFNSSGRENTFVGVNSGYSNVGGIWNTFIGLQSGYLNSSGNNNTFVGLNAGYNSTNSNNTFLGTQAGFHNRDGSNNLVIGYNAQCKNSNDIEPFNNSEYEIVIGANAIGNGSNTITLGATGNPPVSAKLYIPGLQFNATTADVLTLTADGDIALVTPGSSDDRIKTHEEIISSETYINYIKQIVPKKYKKYGFILTQEEEAILEAGDDPFKEKKTGDVTHDSKYIPRSEIGVIAQDIYEIPGLQDFVKKGDEDIIWAVDYTSINTITLGAVKELIDKIEKLEAKITTSGNK